jgi:hypothetical protein
MLHTTEMTIHNEEILIFKHNLGHVHARHTHQDKTLQNNQRNENVVHLQENFWIIKFILQSFFLRSHFTFFSGCFLSSLDLKFVHGGKPKTNIHLSFRSTNTGVHWRISKKPSYWQNKTGWLTLLCRGKAFQFFTVKILQNCLKFHYKFLTKTQKYTGNINCYLWVHEHDKPQNYTFVQTQLFQKSCWHIIITWFLWNSGVKVVLCTRPLFVVYFRSSNNCLTSV